MKEETGDILSNKILSKADGICFTSNGVVSSYGNLVMGAGIAKQFAQRWPELPSQFGAFVKQDGNHVYTHNTNYENNNFWIFSFPTKDNWRKLSSLLLIEQSAKELMKMINEMNLHRVYLPFPGVGYGGLGRDEVRVVLSPILDNRVTILSL